MRKSFLDSKIDDIKRDYAVHTTRYLAEKYKVSVSTIRSFLSRKTIKKKECRKEFIA